MKRGKFLVVLLVVAFVLGGVGSVYAALDGNAVMSQYNCTGCHGVSTIKGTDNASTVTKIMDSIAPGGMMANISSVNKLTQAEAQAIADVLFPPTTTACTDYTYSAWSACDTNGQQSRTQTGYLPANCTGTPSAQPVLTQTCNYVPPAPPPPTGTMPVPTGSQVYSYQPVDLPVVSDDPAQAKPIGIGPIATGGDTIDVRVDIGPFAGPVNVSLIAYAPAIDSEDLYFIAPGIGLKKLSDAVGEEEQAERDGRTSSHERERDEHSLPARHFRNLVVWKTDVTSVNEGVFTAKITDLPSGLYPLVLVITPHDNPDNAYRWITYLFIP